MGSAMLYVFGASGHGKVVADICQRAGLEVAGFVDDAAEERGADFFGLPVLGDSGWLEQTARQQSISVALGIGDNAIRERIAARCEGFGVSLQTAIHPSSVIAPSARIGRGTVVMAGVAINPDTVIGAGAIINTGVVIEHDNRVGDFAHFSANAATGGNVTVGQRTHLGLGAVILPNLSVGDDAVIGAGTVVIRNVDANCTMVGAPARRIR